MEHHSPSEMCRVSSDKSSVNTWSPKTHMDPFNTFTDPPSPRTNLHYPGPRHPPAALSASQVPSLPRGTGVVSIHNTPHNKPTRQTHLNVILVETKGCTLNIFRQARLPKVLWGICKCSSRRQLEWREHTGVIGYISSLFHLHGDTALHQNVCNFQSLISSPSLSLSLFGFISIYNVSFSSFFVARSNKSSSNVLIIQWQHRTKSVSLQSSFFAAAAPPPTPPPSPPPIFFLQGEHEEAGERRVLPSAH